MKPRLLLLEDEPTSRMFLTAATAALPVEVEVAQSVAQGLALAADGGHALWLFDANLPDGTGSELLAQLRRRGLDTPAIVHTAAADAAERDRLLGDGFDAVVVKPLSTAAWQQAIRAALEGTVEALPAGPSPADSPAGEAPVWNDAAAAAALGGNPDNIAALRGLFLAELPSVRMQVLTAARSGNEPGMRAVLHRLQASCGLVGAARLNAAGRALHEAPGSAERLQGFIDAVDATRS